MFERGVRSLLSRWAPSLVLPPKTYRSADLDAASYGIVSTRPPIFYVAHWMDERLRFGASLDQLFEHLRDRPAYFLYGWMWNIDQPERVALVRRFERQHRRRYRRHRFIHLCNSVAQLEAFRAQGLHAVLCNHNCLIDESIFTPLPDAAKAFDAVYDARLKTYKRHHLASGIESLALIYALDPGTDDPSYVEQVRRDFSRAHFFNHPDGAPYLRLKPREVNACLNACRVGLCLSRVEGAMYASIEYLLSGLPVVSTRSQGGRDVFFDDAYVRIVDDRPEAVREGVDEMIRRAVPPDTIRERTLDRIRAHRATLVSTVQDIYAREGIARDFASEWKAVFFHKLRRRQSHRDTIRALDAAQRG